MKAEAVASQGDYIQKTSKLVPAEALALYLTIAGQVKAAGIDFEVERYVTLAVAIVICAFIVPFVLFRLKHVRTWQHYAISMVAFALWVFNAHYDRLPPISEFPSLNVLVGSIILLIFTFVAPVLLPEEK